MQIGYFLIDLKVHWDITCIYGIQQRIRQSIMRQHTYNNTYNDTIWHMFLKL